MAHTLTADEAAHRLGIRKATLYTYASRGLVRTVKEGRSSRYLAEDVASLERRAAAAGGHGAAAASALDWGAPILVSDITSIDVDGPRYRGRSAVALAEADVPFEAVFDLLVDATDPAATPTPFPPCSGGLPAAPLVGDTVFSRLLVLVARLVAHDELRLAVTGAVERRRRRDLVRRMIAGCGAAPAPAALAAPTLGEALAHALRVDPALAPALSRALVVCADHELNASTFAARVAASTGADTGSCVAAALATLSGPRHGGATDRVERLLRPVVDGASARRVLTDALAAGDGVAGFGHRLYPDGDPRASALVRWALELAPAAAEPLRLFTALATEATGEHPTLDLGLVLLGRGLGLPEGGPATLFAIGRTAGWIAHVEEQRRSGKLLRPRAVPSP